MKKAVAGWWEKVDKIPFFAAIVILLVSIPLVWFTVSRKTKSTTSQSAQAQATSPLLHTLSATDIDTYKLWSLVNERRTSEGLTALSLNPKLNASALAKCNDMVAKNYWAHVSPDGTQPWQFITDAGVPYIHLGENLADGQHNAAEVLKNWLNSSEHKANILDPKFTDVGYAVCEYQHTPIATEPNQTLLTVQHFAQL